MMTKHTLFLTAILIALSSSTVLAQPVDRKPVRVGIAGLVHSHVHGILRDPNRQDITIVGIAEPNRELAQRYAKQ